MTQTSLNPKQLIEINSDINSDFSNKEALLFRILRWAVRLVKCERSVFVSLEKNSRNLKIIAGINEDISSLLDIDVSENSFANLVFKNKKHIIANEVLNDPYFLPLLEQNPDLNISTIIAVPVFNGEKFLGIIEAINKEDGLEFSEQDLMRLEMLAGLSGVALKNSENFDYQKNQIESLRNDFKISSNSKVHLHEFIEASPVIQDLMDIVKKAAKTNSSILITGESGVGKEIFAEQIFLHSNRNNKPFVRVNCAALSETLMESELFGHVKGAFTSAYSDQEGRFKMADGGTIFLDEVGEIPLKLQPKLLRVIQDKQFERVGSSETISVDVRIVAATNRNLERMVEQNKFREDLFFRLNVLPIRVPPLRARKEDILPIAENFLKKYSVETGKDYTGFSETAVKAMNEYNWPGNIRELENAVARACIIASASVIQSEDLRLTIQAAGIKKEGEIIDELASVISNESADAKTLKNALNAFKKAYLTKILKECSWNQTKAGKILGIQRTYVSRLMSELNVREEHK